MNNCCRLSSLGNRHCSGVRRANDLLGSSICEREMRKQDWARSLRPPHRADKCLPALRELWSKDGMLEEPQVPENGKTLYHHLTQSLAGDHDKRLTMAGKLKAPS